MKSSLVGKQNTVLFYNYFSLPLFGSALFLYLEKSSIIALGQQFSDFIEENKCLVGATATHIGHAVHLGVTIGDHRQTSDPITKAPTHGVTVIKKMHPGPATTSAWV